MSDDVISTFVAWHVHTRQVASYTYISRPLSSSPLLDAIKRLGLPAADEQSDSRPQPETGVGDVNPFASIVSLLASLPGVSDAGDKEEVKPARYLVAKGLPTLPRKVVEKVRKLEFVDMEEFLQASRSLRLAEQGKPSSSLQDSLVGAFSQFQVLQQHRAQR